MPSNFLAYGRNGSIKAPCNGPECVVGGDAAGNLLSLTEAKHPRRASASAWLDTATALKHTVEVAGSLA
jgi:hypothetical protein